MKPLLRRYKMSKAILIILDGFGIGKNNDANAVYRAKTPTIDKLFKDCPHAKLQASGEYVGLPDGQMGNSEVGHLNIGSGRVVYQDLSMINRDIKTGDFFKKEEFLKAIEHAKKNNTNLHLMGLLSYGGVHSHIDHIKALLDLCKKEGIGDRTYLHAILDGRDVDIHSGESDVSEIIAYMKQNSCGKLASISGRYYAMDRDKRYDRTEKYYKTVTSKAPELVSDDAIETIKKSYEEDVTDEFILSCAIENDGKVTEIKSGDSIIFINFRPDRARQITDAFTNKDFAGFDRKFLDDIYYVCMTNYDSSFKNVHIAYGDETIVNTLGEVISKHGLKQLRIAETEKYAHVTYFFNGGREEKFSGEDRILINSPKVATYDLQPEMSAYELTDKLVSVMGDYDLIILNYANTDMVGHTGVVPAIIKAVETVDSCLAKLLAKAKEEGFTAIITADHGNCEAMFDDEGKPITSHTTNPVPVFLYNDGKHKLKDGVLADLAPSLLDILNIEKPKEMTGESLLVSEE